MGNGLKCKFTLLGVCACVLVVVPPVIETNEIVAVTCK